MEIYTVNFIQGILNQIRKQNNHEKYLTIYPFTKFHHIILDFQSIEFPEDCCCCCPIPLDNILGSIEIDGVLYILFTKDTFHILYKNGVHDTLILESQPSELEKLKMKLNHLLDIKMN